MTAPAQKEKERILIVCQRNGLGYIGYALVVSTGEVVASHCSSDEHFLRRDMGLNGGTWKHDRYAAVAPQGYELVDLVSKSGEELRDIPEYVDALRRNHLRHPDGEAHSNAAHGD